MALFSPYGTTHARVPAALVVIPAFHVTGCGRADPPTTAQVGCLTRRSRMRLARCRRNPTRVSRRPMQATMTMLPHLQTSTCTHGWTGVWPLAEVLSRMPFTISSQSEVQHHLPRRPHLFLHPRQHLPRPSLPHLRLRLHRVKLR